MTRVTLTPHGQPTVVRDLVPGWNRLGSDIGAWLYPRNEANPSAPRGVQFRCARGGQYRIEVDDAFAPTWRAEGYLPPRALLTVRPDSPSPTLGLLRPYGNPWDFSGGGGDGIDACGSDGSVHLHDATMQRHAVGLYDMATGKLRSVAQIPTAGYYHLTRGSGKVTTIPDYVTKPADPYDDTRYAADVTPIPDVVLRANVLSFQAYDGQHMIRAYRFALRHLTDPIVQDDLRAMVRECEVAWNAAREEAVLASPGGRGHYEIGREWAWVSCLAAVVERMDSPIGRWLGNLTGSSSTARMRRIARHVAHRETGVLQRFVEGMSGSPYPYGDYPASGVPAGQGIGLTQHLEACAQITALDALGLKRECVRLAKTILGRKQLKWIDTDTGLPQGGGWHGPADDQAWPAIAVLTRHDQRAGYDAAMRHKIPNDLGEWQGPYKSLPEIKARLASWIGGRGKARWMLEVLP